MSVFDDPGFRDARDEVADYRDEAVSSLRAEHAALQREFEEHQREKARRDEEQAAAARRGELGPERQQLQRRIDAGETTWADVHSGRDDHPSARAVRSFIQRNAELLAAQLSVDPEFQRVRAQTQAVIDEAAPGPGA